MASSNGMVQASVPFFNGDNFDQWKFQMEVFLKFQDVFRVVRRGITHLKPEATESDRLEHKEAKKKDKKALYFIHQGIDKAIFRRIEQAKTSKEAWDTLARNYKAREMRIPIPEQALPSDGPDSKAHGENTVVTYTDDSHPIFCSCIFYNVVGVWISGEKTDKYLEQCVTMHRAAVIGDWKTAEAVINESPDIVRKYITSDNDTPLHIAVAARQTFFVKKLLEKMENDDIGSSAFDLAVASGVKEIVEMMLEKNPTLVSDASTTFFSITFGNRELMLYLFNKIDLKSQTPFIRGYLFLLLVKCRIYDIALETFKTDKSLALFRMDDGEPTALDLLAIMPSAIASESRLGVFKRSINFCCKSIFQDALMGTCAHQLVDKIWKKIIGSPKHISDFMTKSPDLLFDAAELGNVELLVILLRSYPELIKRVNRKGLDLFHVAVIYRQESVFNRIYELGALKDFVVLKSEAGTNNNILHLAATLPPPHRLHAVSGAALQMQRELIWFETVKDLLPRSMRNLRNADGDLAWELFTRYHEDLRKEGEEWMKKTAESCMLVATLVATVVFAAAFTVPGGNKEETGIPIFRRDKWFNIFAVSDAVALSTSSLAIVLFLSILTSRYAIVDFHRSLPLQLVCGLLTLAISISAMVVAFSASFFLVYKQKISWIPILSFSLALAPTALYLLMHGKLLFDTISSTIRSNSLFRGHGSKLYPRKHASLLSWVLRSRFYSIWPRRKTNLS